MGWGNVTKALSLAQADLASIGITNPTPQQLQTALTGGSVTVLQGATVQTVHMDGVLTMHSQGMGWGQIAHKLDLHPGTAFKPARAESLGHETHHALDADHHGIHHAETAELHEEHHHALTASGNAVNGTSRVTTVTGKRPPYARS